METATKQSLAPDITRDRIVVIAGCSSLLMQRKFELVDDGKSLLTLVPVEKLTEPERLSAPRPDYVAVQHAVYIGTVDELTENYRRELTRLFNSFVQPLAESKPSWLEIIFGEHSFRKQTECLKRNGLDEDRHHDLQIDPDVFQAEMDRYHTEFGMPKPRQSAILRDLLGRLVAMHIEATTVEQSARDGLALGFVGRETDHIKNLIADLTVYQADQLCREKHL